MPFDRKTYDLDDLGLFDGKPSRGLEHLTFQVGNCACTGRGAITLFDKQAQELLVRYTPGGDHTQTLSKKIPLRWSLTRDVMDANTLIVGESCPDRYFSDTALVTERSTFASAPVHDPADNPIGAVISFGSLGKNWTTSERQRVREAAFLVSQHILLKASLATIHILSQKIEEQRNDRVLN